MADPAPRGGRLGLRASGLALLTASLWGGNAVSIKVGLQGMPPLAMAGVRFAIGGAAVLAGARMTRTPVRVQPGEWLGLAALSGLFAIQIALLNLGTQLSTAGRSAVLINTYPFFTALSAHFLLPGDRLDAPKVGGLLLSFAGVALLFAESLAGSGRLLGDAVLFTSALLLGLRQVVLKRLVRDLHPFKVVFWQGTLSLPAFALASALWEREAGWQWSLPVAGALLYQGVVVAGVCFVLWVSLLRRHSASRLGVFGFATPVSGVLLSALLLGEELSPVLLSSMALVAAGIAVVNREGRDAQA